MTTTALLYASLAIISVLAIPAAMYRDSDFSPILLTGAALLCLLLGLTMYTSPVNTPTSTNITETSTGYTVQPVTEEMPSALNTGAAGVFTLAGLFGIYTANKLRKHIQEVPEDELDGLEEL